MSFEIHVTTIATGSSSFDLKNVEIFGLLSFFENKKKPGLGLPSSRKESITKIWCSLSWRRTSTCGSLAWEGPPPPTKTFTRSEPWASGQPQKPTKPGWPSLENNWKSTNTNWMTEPSVCTCEKKNSWKFTLIWIWEETNKIIIFMYESLRPLAFWHPSYHQ